MDEDTNSFYIQISILYMMTITTRRISDKEFDRIKKIQELLHKKGYDLNIDEIGELMSEFLLDKTEEFIELIMSKSKISSTDRSLDSLLFDEVVLPDDAQETDSVRDHDIIM